jgi:uncharacterized protein YjbI with pentapeptide repeats
MQETIENEAAERATITDGTPRCPVEMWLGKVCGRPIHPAPDHDKTPVCLMHSRDPEKSDSEFQKEFDAILKAAAERDGVADFSRFVFPSASYEYHEFPAKCIFLNASFTQEAYFSHAKFAQLAVFYGATFAQKAYFSDATFAQKARFFHAKFAQAADFSGTKFVQEANFYDVKFAREAPFSGAEFAQAADFSDAKFAQKANFYDAKFMASADFRETTFRKDKKLSPGPVFCMAEFSHPEAIVFYKTYLGQALFHNCDVSKVTFSSVEWRRRKGSGRRMLFEEEVDLNRKPAHALEPSGDCHDERDYGLIAEIYQQLKKNYDERKDYWTAGDFHYGEMEMKRLHSRSRRPWVRWLHRNLGLVAWYKYVSSHGESYLRPLLALAIVLVIFTVLYPLAGLSLGKPAAQVSATVAQQASPPVAASEVSYWHFAEFLREYPGRKWIGGFAFFGHSLMTTLGVAVLQKELRYEPAYPWGRALALVQLLLTSTLIALYLLALRRQFRR